MLGALQNKESTGWFTCEVYLILSRIDHLNKEIYEWFCVTVTIRKRSRLYSRLSLSSSDLPICRERLQVIIARVWSTVSKQGSSTVQGLCCKSTNVLVLDLFQELFWNFSKVHSGPNMECIGTSGSETTRFISSLFWNNYPKLAIFWVFMRDIRQPSFATTFAL